ncbi:MAG: dihydrodipicolinate reductase C-terminal domain-containing protein [Gemmatimonadaceae bacterium]|nr:dihydrodipicolinate reductase C-terminal domain-containing protein [Gemmatimonadaceae bacterium]
MTLRIAVFGVGRLGREIVALAPDRDAQIVATFGREPVATVAVLRDAAVDVAIDVSVAEAVTANAAVCLDAGVPLVIGVTGWHAGEAALRRDVAARQAAVLVAPNFSVGATLFAMAVADAAHRFSAALGFDAHLVETHHALKKDAPSGTARHLAAEAEAARGSGVPVTSIRVGHVPGVHTLVLDAPYEQVTLTHEARDRRVFADGALLAARWMVGKQGWFTMSDVVRDLTGDPR